MVISGLTVADFEAIVQQVSEQHYDGNVVPEWRKYRAGAPSLLNAKGTRFRGRVVVMDSSGSGARRSWTGRRMPAACWHVFRDVVREHAAGVIVVTHDERALEVFDTLYDMEDGVIQPRLVSTTSKGVPA